MPPPPYVTVADGAVVRVHADDPSAARALVALGFHAAASDSEYECEVHDESEEAQLLSGLRDAGIRFARADGWSPAHVFEHLRRRGRVVGPFQSITWLGPNDWVEHEE